MVAPKLEGVEGLKNEIWDRNKFVEVFQVTGFDSGISFSIRPPEVPPKKHQINEEWVIFQNVNKLENFWFSLPQYICFAAALLLVRPRFGIIDLEKAGTYFMNSVSQNVGTG